ncbi:MAG TPA: hypothetical protein VF593_13825 [Chthoniobacteraceae bacterium]|jgi:hypothetical protein
METPDHQEWRARQRVSPHAILVAAAVVGTITFVFAGGSPWTTAGTMNSVMGRVVKTNFAALIIFHFLSAFAYATALAFTTYRFRLAPAILIGVATGAALYGISFAIFFSLGIRAESPESRALLSHIVFALFATVVYKATSVPKPIREPGEKIPAPSPPGTH